MGRRVQPLRKAPLLGYYTMAGGEAAPIPWYLSGGVSAANCVAAYQPKGAASYAASKINLAKPGTYDAVKVTNDPVLNTLDGWYGFNPLSTGITPKNDQTWSMIIKFSGATEINDALAGSDNTLGEGKFYLYPRRAADDDRLYGNGGFSALGSRVADGVMAISGNKCYYNGDLDGTVDTAWDVGARSILIGAKNIDAGTDGITANNEFVGFIQAIAIYDIPIDAYVSALTTAMNAIEMGDYVMGVWSWFTKPTCVYYDGNLYFTVINTQQADLMIYKYDPVNKLLTYSTLSASYTNDDHALASILIRDSDHRILAFGAEHNDSTITLWTSTNAEDVSAWGAGASLDASIGGGTYNYPIPIQLTGEASDPIYLFYNERGDGIKGEYYSVSTDSGATWSAGTQVFTNGAERPYFQIISNGVDRIDFACTQGHPGEVAGCSIYHFYYTGGSYYKSDGTLIEGALPLETTDVTLVYDGTTTEAWVWDIAIDSSGYPVIVYATFPTPASDHRYRYARWNGTAWIDNEICTAGAPLYAAETYYSGGITIDKGNPSIVWCSRVVGGQWEIFKYITTDNGVTWDAGTALTSSSTSMNARPVCADGTTGLEPLYWTGTYTAYDNCDCNVKFR